MKVFNGKAAAEQYMSSHTLAYSTPEMTLKKFAYWLGDLVDVDCNIETSKCPNEDGLHPKHRLPRLMLFVETKDIPYTVDQEETDETKFKPSGAVADWYNVKKLYGEPEEQASEETKFCFECGAKISKTTRFCPQCGMDQEK
jgi:NADH pyrophosphatase NudC (nudix superfamily)